MKTAFIVEFEYLNYTDTKKKKAKVEVHTKLKLDDENQCDEYVSDYEVNRYCMNNLSWSLIHNWKILSMFEHEKVLSEANEFEANEIIESKFRQYDKETAKAITKTGYKALRKAQKSLEHHIVYAPYVIEQLEVVVDSSELSNKLINSRYAISKPANSIESTIKNELAVYNPVDFLKMIFGDSVGWKEPLIWNDTPHMYISSGSTRDVYVDPTWSYVIKKNGDTSTPVSGNQFNAVEVWDYWNTVLDDTPKVPTRLVQNETGDILIQQDFLIVMNVSRGKINPVFKEVFKPKESVLTDIYGFQYGWNRKSQRIELYDTSDAFLGRGHISNSFEASYDLFEMHFKDFDCFDKIHFRNSFILFDKTFWNKLCQIDSRPECQLLHQDGILFNHKDKTITVCGSTFANIKDELQQHINKFLSQYKPDSNYFKALESKLLTR